jgi:RNA polymerase sigma factor for flagellar operon FliA
MLPDSTGAGVGAKPSLKPDLNRLIETYRSYAHALAAEVLRTLPATVDKDDVRGAAELGLVEAANSFDPLRGVLFKTFAYYRIRGAVYDALRKMGWFRKESSKLQFEASANEYMKDYSTGASPDPPPTNAFEELNHISGSILTSFMLSLESLPQESFEQPGRSPEQHYSDNEQMEKLHKSLAQLPARNREVLEQYYFKEQTLEDIGSRLGLSKSWVCRLHAKSLDMLRQLLEESGINSAELSSGGAR